MLDWLPLSDRKGLPTPRVVLRDVADCSGRFYCRLPYRWVEHDIDIERSERDVILLSTHWGEPSASTIAHEHRHFQQRYLTGLPQSGHYRQPFSDGGTVEGWRIAIRRYYREHPWEMDALRYSARVHVDDHNDAQLHATFGALARGEDNHQEAA